MLIIEKLEITGKITTQVICLHRKKLFEYQICTTKTRREEEMLREKRKKPLYPAIFYRSG
jgi:hypothetical protein